jgi:hypothetical protein
MGIFLIYRAELELKATTIQNIQGIVPVQKTLAKGKNIDEMSSKKEERNEEKTENKEN